MEGRWYLLHLSCKFMYYGFNGIAKIWNASCKKENKSVYSVTVTWLLKISITNLHTVVFDMPQIKTHFCKCAEVLEATVQETGFEHVHRKNCKKCTLNITIFVHLFTYNSMRTTHKSPCFPIEFYSVWLTHSSFSYNCT